MGQPQMETLVSGHMDQNLRSISWWFNFDPYHKKETSNRTLHQDIRLVLLIDVDAKALLVRAQKTG